MKPGNMEIEDALEKLPDKVADQLLLWRTATLNREKTEALLFLKFKASGNDRTATEIKAMVHSDESRYAAVLEELKAESNYERLYERLMSFKKRADLRTAY